MENGMTPPKGAKGSHLSLDSYKYGCVVATTEASINATMKQYLATLNSDEINLAFTYDKKTKKYPLVDFKELVEAAHGSNPFNVPADADPDTNQDLKNLWQAGFRCAFRLKLGLPAGMYDKSIVKLGNMTERVLFNLTFSDFVITQLAFNTEGSFDWTYMSQDNLKPWVFQSYVDLRKSIYDTDSTYTKLPKDIQDVWNNLEDKSMFSVQQLLFDLRSAQPYGRITIPNLSTDELAYMLIDSKIFITYFDELKRNEEPLLGAAIVPKKGNTTPTLEVTAMNFMTSELNEDGKPLKDLTPEQQRCSTLNYLCAVNDEDLKPRNPFTWNWVEPDQLSELHGIIAVNRTNFAKWVYDQVKSLIPPNCVFSYVNVSATRLEHFDYDFWNNQPPKVVEFPTSGPRVLHCSYDDRHTDGSAGYYLGIEHEYTFDVDFVGDKLIVTQHQYFHIWADSFPNSGSGDPINKKITDTFRLAVKDGVLLLEHLATDIDDQSYNPSYNSVLDFFGPLKALTNRISNLIKGFDAVKLGHPPFNTLQRFVFPGGNTFAFKSVRFSDFQDLIADITYADPSLPGNLHTVPSIEKSRQQRQHGLTENVALPESRNDHTM